MLQRHWPVLALPPAEDAEEAAMDARRVRITVDLDRDLYQRLQAEKRRRRVFRMQYSIQAIIVGLILEHVPEELD